MKMIDPFSVKENKKGQPITVIPFELEADALSSLVKILGENAIEMIPPEKSQEQTQRTRKKRVLQSEEGQFETRESSDNKEGRAKPEKWVHAKPKIKIKVRVEFLIERDCEEIMKKAHQIVKDTEKTKIHLEINAKTRVLDSIVFEFASSEERNLFKEKIARAEKKVCSSKLAKDIEEPVACTLRVNAPFIRGNKKLIAAIIEEIESPEKNVAKTGFFKKTTSTKVRTGELVLGSQKTGATPH